MQTASVLYLAQAWEEGVDEYVAIASKTYEYLATGVPILAEVPPGDNADVIRRYAHRSWVVTSQSVDALTAVILDAYTSREQHERRVTPEFARTFNRRQQAAHLASLFDRVTSAAARAAADRTDESVSAAAPLARRKSRR